LAQFFKKQILSFNSLKDFSKYEGSFFMQIIE